MRESEKGVAIEILALRQNVFGIEKNLMNIRHISRSMEKMFALNGLRGTEKFAEFKVRV